MFNDAPQPVNVDAQYAAKVESYARGSGRINNEAIAPAGIQKPILEMLQVTLEQQNGELSNAVERL